MAQARPFQTNFTGGELSDLLVARVDTAKYQNGCKLLENFIVMPHGGAKRRPGSLFVAKPKSHAETGILQRFQYNVAQTYMLFFGPSYIRFYTPGGGVVTQAAQNITGITKANPAVVTYSGSDTYANGDRVIITGVVGMTEVNGREFTVANVNTGANTFELSGVNSSSYTTYVSGGSVAEILEVAHTYTEAQLPDLRFTQSNDQLYIFHSAHIPAVLTRNSALSWTLSNLAVLRGPWRNLNPDETITIKSNDKSGSVTLQASAALFDALHVGAKFKMYTPTRANGERQFGDGANVNAGDYWSAGERVYEIPSIVNGAQGSDRFNPPTHLQGTVSLYLGGDTSTAVLAKFVHQGFGIATVTAFTDSTHVTATVYSGYGYLELPLQMVDSAMTGGLASNARYAEPTSFWQEGAWSDYRGYPGIATLYEQRLFAANNGSQTQTIWGSVTGSVADFEEGTDDDKALNYAIASEEADVIRWMVPGKQLLIGTISGEYVMMANSLGDAITPDNIRVPRQTKYGSSKAQPIQIGNAVLFVQRHGDPANYGRKIREMGYNYQSDSWEAPDLTIWSNHITGTGVSALCYQSEPDGLVWAPRVDGYIAGLTYQPEQEVKAFHRHYLGGWSDAGSATRPIVESIESMPGSAGDEVWMLVKRYVNGGVERQIELLSNYTDETEKEDYVFLDSALRYDGASTSTLTGLWHLIGQSVYVYGNGAKQGPFTVSATGTVTLTTAITVGCVGLAYTSKLQTMDIEAAAQAGTAQTRPKRVSNVGLRVVRSLGGRFGGNENQTLDSILYRTPADPMGQTPDLYTGDIQLNMPTNWQREGTVYVENSEPFPMTILGVVAEISVTG